MKPYLRLFPAVLLACGLFSISQAALANIVIEPTPTLPPVGGAYTLQPLCENILPMPFCLNNIVLSNFQIVSSTFSGAGQTVMTNADYNSNVLQNIGGNPGMVLGPLSATGTVDFLYQGRTGPLDLGTFTTVITSFNFSGMFMGHQFQISDNPSMTSMGSTSITAPGFDGPFSVSSTIDLFGQISIDGGTPVPGPMRVATLTPVPEPSSVLLLLTAVAGGAAVLRRRRKNTVPLD